MELLTVPIEKPDDVNVILGQAHFIKTVDDVFEALAGSSPHLRFGLAFCESSGPCLVRRAGNDEELVALAVENALAVGAGHCAKPRWNVHAAARLDGLLRARQEALIGAGGDPLLLPPEGFAEHQEG